MTDYSEELTQRVWEARRQIQRDHLPYEKFTVILHPSRWARTVMSTPHPVAVHGPDGVKTFYGLPVEVDPHMSPEDRVVLRYEVEA